MLLFRYCLSKLGPFPIFIISQRRNTAKPNQARPKSRTPTKSGPFLLPKIFLLMHKLRTKAARFFPISIFFLLCCCLIQTPLLLSASLVLKFLCIVARLGYGYEYCMLLETRSSRIGFDCDRAVEMEVEKRRDGGKTLRLNSALFPGCHPDRLRLPCVGNCENNLDEFSSSIALLI